MKLLVILLIIKVIARTKFVIDMLFYYTGHSFAQRSTWVSHMVRHSGVTPHICNECGKAFATKGDLTTHKWSHRPDKRFLYFIHFILLRKNMYKEKDR